MAKFNLKPCSVALAALFSLAQARADVVTDWNATALGLTTLSAPPAELRGARVFGRGSGGARYHFAGDGTPAFEGGAVLRRNVRSADQQSNFVHGRFQLMLCECLEGTGE